MRSKRAIAPLFVILFVVLALIVIYVFLFLPIPGFTKIRFLINYFILIITFILMQVGLVYAYFRLGKLAVQSSSMVKNKFIDWTINVRNYIVTHA